jgi:hypothetical protein
MVKSIDEVDPMPASYAGDDISGRGIRAQKETILPLSSGQMPLWFREMLRIIDSSLRAATYLQFLKDVFEIVSHSFVAQLEESGDLLVRFSFRDEG